MTEDLRFPVGKFIAGAQPPTDAERAETIEKIAAAPAQLRAAITGLTAQQLETPYRPDGWTVRQVVHHVADSHMNAYIRFRLGLTEAEPTIKPYDEGAWAELADAKTADLEVSLILLEKIHERWTMLMRALPAAAFARKFKHPEAGLMSLDTQLGLYEWHGRHHIAHITKLREREGWN